ncbi:sugar phosphate isomerase/epimerase family protein [Paludibaculum fermentans]|uniref:Sugar phosphate isomerase/epimerase n=1 Tax=Paludibaculum fermentans TaxID=1473598 RepID=A0A7S7NQN3_PALFE|nr:sugar phosphate isomerase/epimerase family protein [Paludibaculum fermentans]QOY88002.1 sugar phosphate isomerase/epimerase [Paludibaculum fermentans]
MTRRDVLALAGSLPGFLSSTAASAQTSAGRRMGGTPTAFLAHVRAAREGGGPFDIVEHCHQMGLAGVQTNPPSMDPEAIRKFRERLESYRMHLVTDPRLPKDASEVAAFDAQVKAHKEAGAVAFHAALTGRRYDDFTAFEPWKEMFLDRQRQVQLAEPVLRKYKVPLGLENHKGYRSAEQAAWLKRLGSEWVGVCLDFGNNLSLCEDPLDTARTLAPYTVYAHIKDMAMEEYEDGFLLSEVPFGEGLVDLPQIIAILRKKDPNMIFNLEMITRDPLKIPVFTPKYWATFDDSYSPLPGRDLAKVLDLVHKHKPKQPLPRTAGLSVAQQLKLEDELNQKCATYAREHLAL